MAHAVCINGHTLWNGDGKPCAEAYRISYFRELLEREPDCVIRHDYSGKYPEIYDCVDDVPGEDLDVWCCDECGSFFVFVNWDKARYDYVPCDLKSINPNLDYKTWEEYISFRQNSEDFDPFHDYCEGKSPLDALLTYGFKNSYYLSPDKELIVKVEGKKQITQIYKLARYIDFTKENEKE